MEEDKLIFVKNWFGLKAALIFTALVFVALGFIVKDIKESEIIFLILTYIGIVLMIFTILAFGGINKVEFYHDKIIFTFFLGKEKIIPSSMIDKIKIRYQVVHYYGRQELIIFSFYLNEKMQYSRKVIHINNNLFDDSRAFGNDTKKLLSFLQKYYSEKLETV